MKPTIIAALLILLGCTTASTQYPQPAPPSAQAAPPAQAAASQYKNLQVLPPDIPREQLLEIMRTFTRSLGVRCNHCHVVTATEPKEVLDFPNDTKEEKRVARVMIQMVQQINGAWMDRVEQAEHGTTAAPSASAEPPEMRVGCWTCHRGQKEPEMPPPPPAN